MKESNIVWVGAAVAAAGSLALGFALSGLHPSLIVYSILGLITAVAVIVVVATICNEKAGEKPRLRGQDLLDQLELEGKARRIPGTKNYHVDDFTCKDFTEGQKTDIRWCYDGGETIEAIAKSYKVTENYIRFVLRETRGKKASR